MVAMESLEVAMGLTTTISKAMDMDTRAIELFELVELPGLPRATAAQAAASQTSYDAMWEKELCW